MEKETLREPDTSDHEPTLRIGEHFATFMLKLAGEKIPELFKAAVAVSTSALEGHVCLDLSSIAGASKDAWITRLRNTPVVGEPGKFTPLILDDAGRLYLYRYFEYEQMLATLVRDKIAGHPHTLDFNLLREGLARLFPKISSEEGPDWQKIAAFIALSRNFCIISGGPGTGKTHTIVKVMALLLEQAKDHKLRIALVTPTGKAAARLKESIRETKGSLECAENVRAMIPEEVSTIHRILGTIPGSSYFHYNEKNLLPYDVIIVDEASMVDLPLMAKLGQAIPPGGRLILLGDKDQLASVEAGAVLGDMCGSENLSCFSQGCLPCINEITGEFLSAHAIGIQNELLDSIVQLQKNYRFGITSGIHRISKAVRAGDGESALTFLKGGDTREVSWKRCPPPDTLEGAIGQVALQEYGAYSNADTVEKALHLFNQFCILCALRRGPYGAAAINRIIEKTLQRAGLIEAGRRWYRGQTVMITRNDYHLGLFNGDIGMLWPDPESDEALRAYFPAPDGALRKILPSRLPVYELVYAMTVHKSQGSEFRRVLLLLPDRDAKILTRELIYTGITRARENVEIWGRETVFIDAVSRRIKRQSGLRDTLWGRE
ncbi:MAG: exodeoxyribonuclease V subunit alpha [bacterium]